MKIGTDAMVFGAFISVDKKNKALDIGSGTGVLSLMMAQKNELLKISAIEIDEMAFSDLKLNSLNSPYKNQIETINDDFLTHVFGNKFDLIFSNPPYFENSLKSENKANSIQKNLARHTDSLPFEDLILKVSNLLTEDGEFWIILPSISANKFQNLAFKSNLFLKQEIIIYAKEDKITRKILCLSFANSQLITTSLIIRDKNNEYTNQYKTLTKDFHGKKL